MNSCEVTAYITALANIIYSRVTAEEAALLSAFFNQLGDTLATKLAFDAVCNGASDANIAKK